MRSFAGMHSRLQELNTGSRETTAGAEQMRCVASVACRWKLAERTDVLAPETPSVGDTVELVGCCTWIV